MSLSIVQSVTNYLSFKPDKFWSVQDWKFKPQSLSFNSQPGYIYPFINHNYNWHMLVHTLRTRGINHVFWYLVFSLRETYSLLVNSSLYLRHSISFLTVSLYYSFSYLMRFIALYIRFKIRKSLLLQNTNSYIVFQVV